MRRIGGHLRPPHGRVRTVWGRATASGGAAKKALRTLIEARLREHPDWLDRMIGNKLGCSHTTVAEVRAQLEAARSVG